MSWASKRQFKYISIVVIFLALIIFAILSPIIFKKPTCSDNKKNGDETGVDCGGSCQLMCKSDIYDPATVWSRAFPVVGTTYNLVAYVENRNKDAGVEQASYQFKVYNTYNELIGTREGQTFIPPNQQFAVFESRFEAGSNKIKTVTFEFSPSLVWVKKEPILPTLPISVSNIIFDNNKDTPNLSAVVNNESIYDLPEFDVIAILYDAERNAINASKTFKTELLSNHNLPVFFTWPETLTATPLTEEVLIQVNPFSISF